MISMTSVDKMSKVAKTDDGRDVLAVCMDGVVRLGVIDWADEQPRLWVGQDYFFVTHYELVAKV